MPRQRPRIVALAHGLAHALALVAGLAAAGAVRAHGAPDVHWSVTIGAPAVMLPPPALPHVVLPAPPMAQVRVLPVHHPRPAWRDGRAYREPTRWDVDGDGIPNRHDRLYNPRWDVDGDGIPNRRDRYDGTARWDRDRGGIPSRRDPYDRDHPRRGR